MNEQRDPLLQQLFDEPHTFPDQEQFTVKVMHKSRSMRLKQMAPRAMLLILLVLGGLYLFSGHLITLAPLIVKAATIPLADLGSGWLAWVLAPVNNTGSLMVLCFKAFRSFRKLTMKAGYAG